MQHRIVVVDTRAGVPVADAQRHWRERHPAVYTPAPNLLGYVQNRPLEEEWGRLGTRSICSETWFRDHAAEKESFASAYYRETVMPDEDAFLDRDSAWMGRVVEEAGWPAGPPRYRVLAFGAVLAGADVLRIDREPSSVSSLWLDDRDRALEVARAAPGLAFAAEPAVFLVPPA